MFSVDERPAGLHSGKPGPPDHEHLVLEARDVEFDWARLSIEHTLQQIERVTVEEVNMVARRLLGNRYGAAVLGPYGSKRQLPQQLRAMVN